MPRESSVTLPTTDVHAGGIVPEVRVRLWERGNEDTVVLCVTWYRKVHHFQSRTKQD